MDLQKRIEAFSRLGKILRSILDGESNPYGERIEDLIRNQHKINPWFTKENVRMAIRSIADNLNDENLNRWTTCYPDLKKDYEPLKAAVIMAGNIPLVGFHDFLSVLISGNRLIAKTSSKDPDLLVHLGEILCSLYPEFCEMIEFTSGVLSGFDIVIATGSDNNSRYFEYYFGKYPHIIRKNRNSIAVIEGNESDDELNSLGKDVFSYFGLGCRNVSKIYIPGGYDFEKMISCWEPFSRIVYHSKYANNYDHNKAIYLINREKFLDTGFLLLKEELHLASPVGVLYYQYYNSIDDTRQFIDRDSDIIQCITGRNWIPFGKTQSPELWDYSDNIDTLDFLLKKNMVRIL